MTEPRVTGKMTRVWREISAAGGEQAPLRWQAEMGFGDTWTTDGRFLSIDGAELPKDGATWPLMSMLMDDHGTFGGLQSFVAGHGDKMWWDGNVLMGEGSFNEQAAGLAAAQAIEDGDVVGVSLDTFPLEWEITIPVSDDDWLFFRKHIEGLSSDEITTLVRKGVFTPKKLREHLAMEVQEDDDGEPTAIVITEGVDDMPKIRFVRWQAMGVTQVPFPAFEDARIAVVGELEQDRLAAGGAPVSEGDHVWVDEQEGLTASAAGLAPLAAPSHWFDVPEPDHFQALTVTKEGRVFGHVARWGACHTAYGISMGQGKTCVQAPKSYSRYGYYMTGHYLTEDDRDVTVGIISLSDDPQVGHADLGMSVQAVREHYEAACTQAAYVVAEDGKHGIWVCGTVAPQVPAEKVVQLRASTPSGDWRNQNGHLEMIGVLAVNIGGFPTPRARLVAGAAEDEPELVALVAAGYPDRRLTPAERRAKAIRIAGGRAGLLTALESV